MDAVRVGWTLGGAALLGALCWPLVHGRDGFPLSTYPMFSSKRDATASVAHVIGVRADGSGAPLAPAMLGTAEIMQASQIARNAVKDRRRAADLCERVAERVAAEGAEFVAVEVRTDKYDAITYWSGDRSPLASRVHARCDVGPPT